MKRFNVYKHPTRGWEAVKIGFSWPAFVFTSVWMLLKRLWQTAVIWIVLELVARQLAALAALAERLDDGSARMSIYLGIIVAGIALRFVAGRDGNSWREYNLQQRGYRYMGTIEAGLADAAIAQAAESAGSSQYGERS